MKCNQPPRHREMLFKDGRTGKCHHLASFLALHQTRYTAAMPVRSYVDARASVGHHVSHSSDRGFSLISLPMGLQCFPAPPCEVPWIAVYEAHGVWTVWYRETRKTPIDPSRSWAEAKFFLSQIHSYPRATSSFWTWGKFEVMMDTVLGRWNKGHRAIISEG